jgi:hypothetical protein
VQQTRRSLIELLVPIKLTGAARPNEYVCGLSFAGIVGSNPAGAIDVCFLTVFCVVK